MSVRYYPSQKVSKLFIYKRGQEFVDKDFSLKNRWVSLSLNDLKATHDIQFRDYKPSELLDLAEKLYKKFKIECSKTTKLKKRLKMPIELKGKGYHLKKFIMTDLKICELYFVDKVKDFRQIKDVLKVSRGRINRVVINTQKSRKLPLQFPHSKKKLPDSVNNFIKWFFHNKENVFKKIPDIQKEVFNTTTPNIKVGWKRIRNILWKTNIRWKRTRNKLKMIKASEESDEIVFRKLGRFLDILDQKPNNFLSIDEKFQQVAKDFSHSWSPTNEPTEVAPQALDRKTIINAADLNDNLYMMIFEKPSFKREDYIYFLANVCKNTDSVIYAQEDSASQHLKDDYNDHFLNKYIATKSPVRTSSICGIEYLHNTMSYWYKYYRYNTKLQISVKEIALMTRID